jgi:hypothetical protein
VNFPKVHDGKVAKNRRVKQCKKKYSFSKIVTPPVLNLFGKSMGH